MLGLPQKPRPNLRTPQVDDPTHFAKLLLWGFWLLSLIVNLRSARNRRFICGSVCWIEKSKMMKSLEATSNSELPGGFH